VLSAIYQHLLKRVPAKTDALYDQLLVQYSSYYDKLNAELKVRFRFRLFALLNRLRFLPGPEMTQVTTEMRVVIGCAIIEMTFGLEGYLPERFKTVIVMRRRYAYPGYGQPFLGHVDPKKDAVYFSWEDVQHGYLVPDDALNVALHEMAHVLEHENAYFVLYSRFFDRVNWERWGEVAFEKMEKIRAKQHDFLKSYGGTNMSEMFAVCVETFFEQPQEFSEQLPELYQKMVELLRQDPLRGDHPILDF
jgi:hypothetical protein